MRYAIWHKLYVLNNSKQKGVAVSYKIVKWSCHLEAWAVDSINAMVRSGPP